MDHRSLSMDIRSLSKSIHRYLGETMPENARIATGGNAHIIMFLARNPGREICQHDIERQFCITRSTASRVLALMEKKGLIERMSVDRDARLKKLVLTDKADAIVEDLRASAECMERRLLDGFDDAERRALRDYLDRMRANMDQARRELGVRCPTEAPEAPETADAPGAPGGDTTHDDITTHDDMKEEHL